MNGSVRTAEPDPNEDGEPNAEPITTVGQLGRLLGGPRQTEDGDAQTTSPAETSNRDG